MWEGTAPRGSQGDSGLDPRPSELQAATQRPSLALFAAGSHAVLLGSRMARIHPQDREPGPTACDPCVMESMQHHG